MPSSSPLSPHSSSSTPHPGASTSEDHILTIAGQHYDLTQHTPMMVQYLTMKAKYPNALLLYRMGDFYELFFEDAKVAAKLLDITLTRRGKDKAGNTIAMAGVPFHAADSYMARLIAAGQTVVVCEQVEPTHASSSDHNPNTHSDRRDSKADNKKGIMNREVVRTLTAGTLTDDALIAPDHTPTVVAIDIHNAVRSARTPTIQAAISQLDLAAGKIVTQAISADSLSALQAQLLTVLARFAPSECLINERLDESWHQWLSSQIDCPVLNIAAADFNPDHAPATLCQQFDVRQLDGLGIADEVLIQTSCAALIHYARQTQQRQVPHVNQLVIEQSEDYLIIDAGSQRNLELFAPASAQGTPLIGVLNHCQTPMGKRLLQQQLKRPLRDRSIIQQRLDAIDTLLTKSGDQLTALQETLAGIADIERISSRIGLASAKPRDLKRLAESIDYASCLKDQLAAASITSKQAGLLAMLLLGLPNPSCDAQPNAEPNSDLASGEVASPTQVASLIHRAIVDEPPAHIRDGGMIAAGYDADFDRLSQLHDNIEQTLDEMAAKARAEYQLPSLKVGFNKVSGFYFELPKAQAATAPEHFIRRQTLKNSERFITDALKTIETDYLGAQSQALAKEKQLYTELLSQLTSALPQLQQLSQALAQLDVLINWAQLAQQHDWRRPTMTTATSQTPSLDIRQGRHVVVEAAINQLDANRQPQAPQHFVANDCSLGSPAHPERLLLITGPNMGGKSTFMRQTALIVLLACCGSFVPADSATIGDIDQIFTRIGSADDLAGGKSTFMVEMIETAHILNLATDRSLVLMDEVGRGTSTTDGLAIAHACVQRLAQLRCLTLFATHYFELTALARQYELRHHIRNVHVAASEIDGQLLLLHQIKDGAASSSFGLHVAKMAGIPASVLAAAHHYLHAQLNDSPKPTTTAPQRPLSFHDKSDLVKSPDDQGDNEALQTHSASSVDTSPAQVASHDIGYQPYENQQVTLYTALDNINPDELTPKDAHDLLYHLKQLASDLADL